MAVSAPLLRRPGSAWLESRLATASEASNSAAPSALSRPTMVALSWSSSTKGSTTV
jgi:hypothetical protein